MGYWYHDLIVVRCHSVDCDAIGVALVTADRLMNPVGFPALDAGNLTKLVGLDDVAGLEVLEVGQADTALIAVGDFLDVVLEATQR